MGYIILTFIIEAALLTLYLRIRKVQNGKEKKSEQTALRKIKNILMTVDLFCIPPVIAWCFYLRHITGTYVTGKASALYGLLIGYFILGSAGRVSEKRRNINSFYKVFYWIFEILAAIALCCIFLQIIFVS